MNTALAQDHMSPYDMQESNERQYARKHISGYIDKAIRDNPTSELMVLAGVYQLEQWLKYWVGNPYTDQCKTENYYNLKCTRLAQLQTMNLEQLVRTIYVQTAYCQRETLYVSITAQLATVLGFSDRRDSIITIAEIVAVLAPIGIYELRRVPVSNSIVLISKMVLPQNLIDAIHRSLYMPPMVCEPPDLKSNFESPYLTYNECLILGKRNGHSEDIGLDVINTQNKVQYKLDVDFISKHEEVPNHPLDTVEKYKAWKQFKTESYAVYLLMVQQGNRFWLPNRPDKRGRLYCQGYHINSQGTAFKKASLELYHEELVQGVPA